ncbi:MAG: glycosyltransferase [Dysgonamonadaceae bacterium]|jgi:GT2 family glycosyltransferase|nr:glycosyltransferase [Dysgonamonadaceae bacterium]
MISLIVCSKKGDISAQLKLNIENTIGVPYELIIIDNSKNEYSIFQAYNEGVERASFSFLCFMHEDILYHSNDWGKSVIQHLSNPETGLIGLAGSFYLLAIPAPWFKAKPYVKNQIQTDPTGVKSPKRYVIAEDKEVICVDGFWFCSRKDVFKQVSFDEQTFHNFHFYDLDISMQIHEKNYLIYVIADLIVEHSSGGTFNSQWLASAYRFYHKWEKQLPANIHPALKKKTLVNVKAFRDLLSVHKKNNYPISKETLKIGREKLGLNIVTAYLLFYIQYYFR